MLTICTPAAGVLKAIHCGTKPEVNRITKDTVIFHAADFNKLVQQLQLDLHEPPVSQVSCQKAINPLYLQS